MLMHTFIFILVVDLAMIIQNPVQGYFWEVISDVNEPEEPSPFGNYEDQLPINKSLNCTCGLGKLGAGGSPNTMAETIHPSQIPWLVFIYIDNNTSAPNSTSTSTPNKICSGTIINDRVILTAASCIVTIPTGKRKHKMLIDPEKYKPAPEQLYVLLPNSSQLDLNNESTFARLPVKHVTFNPYFVSQRILREKQDWDIAFILLETPLSFSTSDSGLVPLCIPPRYYTDEELVGVGMVSVGWLRTTEVDMVNQETREYYTLKKYQRTYVHPTGRCRAITARDWISNRMFCTNGPPFMNAKFIEAHGAPVLFQSSFEENVFVQYGIVSWDLVGYLVKKKNVRVSTNVSGFLELIYLFSDVMNAKWCSVEANQEEPTSDSGWRGGVELNEPFSLDSLPAGEWQFTTSAHRQYQSDSGCLCGKRNNVSTNITPSKPVRGQNVSLVRKYPWQVQVVTELSSESETYCAGTIINDKIILTSATCVHRLDKMNTLRNDTGQIRELVEPSNVHVHIGNYYSNVETLGHDRDDPIKVDMVVSHVEFRGDLCEASNFDVALIILKEPLDFGKLKGIAAPICLPMSNEDLELDLGRGDAVVLGWGKVVSHHAFPNRVKRFRADILRKSVCKSLWNNNVRTRAISGGAEDNVLCTNDKLELANKFCGASALKNITAPENGDFGGSVMVSAGLRRGSAMVQVGIVSGLTYDLMKELVLQSSQSISISESGPGSEKTVLLYNELQPLLPFIDFFSLVVDATWCPRENLH